MKLPRWPLDDSDVSQAPGNARRDAADRAANNSLRHGGQGLMAWAVANARVEPKGNNEAGLGFGQDRSADSGVNAVALMSANPRSAPSYQMVIL
jgi:phage terminase large subunit-like protein